MPLVRFREDERKKKRRSDSLIITGSARGVAPRRRYLN